jgi:hypothetical protein
VRHSGIAAARTAILVLLCLLLAFGAAAASIADSLDGDDDFSPTGAEIPVLLIQTRCSPPPPSETVHTLVPEREARLPHAPVPPPTSRRAPPVR